MLVQTLLYMYICIFTIAILYRRRPASCSFRTRRARYFSNASLSYYWDSCWRTRPVLKASRGAQRIFSRCSDRSQDTADPEAGLVPQRPEGSASRAGGACKLGGVPGAVPRSPRACSLGKHVQNLSERGCSVAESSGRSGEQKSWVEKLAPRQGDAARAARSSAVSCRGLGASRKKHLGAH